MLNSQTASPGQVLDDQFLLTEQIAVGGMSAIFKAQDLRNANEWVAVKLPHARYSSGAGSWSMFQQEQMIGSRLNHPYVLKYKSGVNVRRHTYVVSEFVEGNTLADRLKNNVPLPVHEALSIASRICEALQYVHDQGYVHYDLKPANVMLCPDGSIRIIDFGLSHAVVAARFSFSGSPPLLGTPDYVAPEQVRRQRGRKSADVYALGAILYEMLTGQPPFPGDDPFKIGSTRLLADPRAPRDLNPEIPPPVEEIVLRALRRKPNDRYPSMLALQADLESPQTVHVSNLRDNLQPVSALRRNLRVARFIALAVLLPIMAQVLLFLMLWRHFAHLH